MKNVLLIILFLITSCKTTQKSNFLVSQDIYTKSINCPENGICSIELIPNKSITFKKDDFGNSYPVISEGEKTLLKYTFKKKPVANTQDSNYTEIIYAELDKTISDISLTNNELQNIKLHFGRLCYCKGETGYYAIKNGTFKITTSAKKSIFIDFNFKITEVPQIITRINETISLKSN